MTVRNNAISKIALVVFSSLVALFLCEILLRISRFNTEPPPRFLFWSSPTFDVDSNGAVSLAKNTRIRDVAVYNGKIEYDMCYQTNNFGSRDNLDYSGNDSAERRYAFVGDSFTAGEGGYPWVSELRNKLVAAEKKVSIYNLALPGAGFLHFQKRLESAARSLSFTDIVILAITDDFYRPYWKPVVRDGKIYFSCDVPSNCPASSIATEIAFDATPADLDRQIKENEKSAEQTMRELNRKSGDVITFLHRSKVLLLMHEAWVRMRHGPAPKQIDYAALAAIRSRFPHARICLFHLPQKNEVRRGAYDKDLQKNIEALGISYFPALYRYHWSNDMFYENDNHPNNHGYGRISDFVEHWLLYEGKS